MASSARDAGPGEAVIWRRELLPASETFILNQLGAYERWRGRLAGVRRLEASLPIPTDAFTLDGASLARRAERWLFARRGVAPSLERLLRRPAVKLVHAHFGPDAVSVLDSTRRARRPLLVTFHGYDAMTRLDARRDWPMTRRWNELVDYAHRFVAVSHAIAARLSELGVPEHKIAVHYIGTPLPPDAGRAATADDGPLLFVGRLVEKKGADTLLNAMAQLPSGLRERRCVVVGDGPLRGQLENRAAALGLTVEFLGTEPPEAVAAWMRSAAALVAPFRPAADGDAEGLGMTLLEAAAARLPVVTCPSGGSTEAVADGETGLIVPADPVALASALARVLGTPGLGRKLGDAGRRLVEERFDIARCTAGLEDDYDRTLSEWRR